MLSYFIDFFVSFCFYFSIFGRFFLPFARVLVKRKLFHGYDRKNHRHRRHTNGVRSFRLHSHLNPLNLKILRYAFFCLCIFWIFQSFSVHLIWVLLFSPCIDIFFASFLLNNVSIAFVELVRWSLHIQIMLRQLKNLSDTYQYVCIWAHSNQLTLMPQCSEMENHNCLR